MAKKNSFFDKIKRSSKYKKTKVGPRPSTKKKSRNLPTINDESFIVIGIDQSVINTGIACLYYDPKNNGSIDMVSCFGDYKDKEHIITNLIKTKDKSRSQEWPDYQEAYFEYMEKLNIMKKLLCIRLTERGIIYQNDVGSISCPRIFVVLESIYFGQMSVVKNLLRHHTVTALNMLSFPINKDILIKPSIYEYSSSEAKQSLGGIGATKDNVTEAVNNIFGTNMPTHNDFKHGRISQSEYDNYSHISDAMALAYAFIKDVNNYSTLESMRIL